MEYARAQLKVPLGDRCEDQPVMLNGVARAQSTASRAVTVRDSIRSFFEPPISADPTHGEAKLIWIVRLRWLALVAQALSIFPALEFEILERRLLPHFLGVIALLSIVNVATWASLRRGAAAGQNRILLQLGFDIAALSTLLALTGGAWNPLVPILFVHAGLGALLLQGRASLFLFGFLVACLAVIQVAPHIPPGLEKSKLPASILFPAQFLLALAFWILTSWLSYTLAPLQRHFALLRERRTRVDRLRAVGALAAGLSHEFATPLNTAQLKLSRLARTHKLDDDPDFETAVSALQRCGEVLRHMAGSQLRPEGLALEAIDVASLVERICTSVVEDRPSCHVEFHASGRGVRRALLPDVAFSQAVLNLLDNAIASGGEERTVEVSVEAAADEISLSVCDRGTGWPDVVRNHLGEPFVTTKPNGVGLGLYYVHTLAEAVGAELHLEDRESGGAIARISIPAVATPTDTVE